MSRILQKRKFILISLMLILIMSNFVISFAYWASNITGDIENSDGSVGIGEWLTGTQIWDTDDFITMLTTSNNTGDYSLAVDLDFENITPPSWTQTKDVIFKGTLDCGNKTISNISLTDYRGIFGVLEGATIKNCIIDGANLNYTTNDSYTSGILAGRLQGTGNLIENITILNSTMTNTSVLAGALIGYISPLSGTGDAIIKDINVSNTTVSGGFSNASYGNGGLIGTVNNFDLTIENADIQADVTSTTVSNVGGLIGAVIGSSVLTIDGANIDQSNLLISGTGSTLGAGGAIGLMLGTSHDLSNINITQSQITSSSLSGGLIGYANQATSTLTLDSIDVSDTDVISSISDASSGAGGIFGAVNGYSVDMTNINVSSDITSSGNANAGGIAAFVSSTAVMDLNNVTIDTSNISIGGTGNTLGAGGLVGLLNGDGHLFTNIDVINTNVSSASLSGGLIGYANQAASSITFNTVDVNTSTISTTISDASSGAGGMIGVINGYNVDMSGISISADVTSTNNANSGGVAAVVTSTAVLDLDDVTITESLVSITGVGNTLGAGGIIGLLNGDNHILNNIDIINTEISSASLSGGLFGYANQALASMTLDIIDITGSTITSSISDALSGAGGIAGVINGYSADMTNVNVSATITSTSNAHVGGITAYATSTSSLTLDIVSVLNSNISISGTSTSLGAGGFIGLLNGNSHLFTNIELFNTQVTSFALSGGVIGNANQTGGTLTIEGVEINASTITSTISDDNAGTGGVIASSTGYQIDVTDALVTSSTTVSGVSSSGGIIGIVNSSVVLDFENITIEGSTIISTSTDNSRGSGGVIGYLTGDTHQFTKIRVNNATITSDTSAGGLIGRSEQQTGTATFNNIKVIDSNLYSSLDSGTSGVAGMIGRNRYYTFTMNDIYIESNISSNKTNTSGIIGFSRYGTLTINRVVIFADLIINNPGTTNNRGAAAIIGRNRDGVVTSSATDIFFTGYFKAKSSSDKPTAGILRAYDTNLVFTNVRSAEITYFLSSNANKLVNSATLYNNMTGQNPAYATTYTTLRSSLTATYWTTNFSNITNSALWSYNATTHLYELID